LYKKQLHSFGTYVQMTKQQALTYPKLTKTLMITAEHFGWGNLINEAVKAF